MIDANIDDNQLAPPLGCNSLIGHAELDSTKLLTISVTAEVFRASYRNLISFSEGKLCYS
jgi:hypothetical protein